MPNNSCVKTILCFGSSTTYGYDPHGGSRFPDDVRWPAVMCSALGSNYKIIEEGLNGRTVLDHVPFYSHANGLQYLEKNLLTCDFDIITIFLGTNDLFANRETSVQQIAEGIKKMAFLVYSAKPKSSVILIAPAPVNDGFEAAYLYQSEVEKSRKFSIVYKTAAFETSSYFVDAGKVISNSSYDGIHPDAAAHITFGKYMAGFIIKNC
jgi:lysophospholipase L1-like esterase